MAVTSGFFNSVNSDRKYNSAQISELFDGLIQDGVCVAGGPGGDGFAVTQNTVPDLHVQVGEGRAWFKHTWTKNDAHVLLTIETPDILYPRIDSVVLEVDRSDNVRANSIKVIKGTPASSPVEPTMQHTSTLDQYRLANIAVAANDTEIINANITYKVGTVETPFLANMVEPTFDVETWLAQMDSYFDNTWLPARENEMETVWWPALSAQLDTLFDNWLATLDDPMLLHTRIGGSATEWNSPGSTSYSPPGAKVVTGSCNVTCSLGQSFGITEVSFVDNFPANTKPMVIVSFQESPQGDIVRAFPTDITNVGFNCTVVADSAQGGNTALVGWMAIGPAA